MSAWPTGLSLVWLAVGLGCLLWTLIVLARQGIAGALSLGVLFVWTTLIGYHLTPWLALETGVWSSSLLVPTKINAGLMSSSLSMIAFIIGYSIQNNLLHRPPQGRQPPATIRSAPWLILILILLVVILFVIRVRGLENVFFAEYHRGWGQFDYSFQGKLLKITYTALLVFTIILTFSSSLVIFDKRLSPLTRVLVGWSGLLVACLPLAHKFSRGAGLPLLMFFFLACYLRGRRAGLTYALIAVLGVYFCVVGYEGRSDFRPGIGNFALAAINLGEEPNSLRPSIRPAQAERILDPGKDNFLNALDAWTLSAQTAESYAGSWWVRLTSFLSVLQPLPSLFVSLTARIGPGLASVLGVSGNYGVTTPALAELHYLFGAYSALFYIFYGLLSGWVDRRYTEQPTFGLLATKLLIAAGFVLALHSGLRASTRLGLYAIILFLFLPWVVRKIGGPPRIRPSAGAFWKE